MKELTLKQKNAFIDFQLEYYKEGLLNSLQYLCNAFNRWYHLNIERVFLNGLELKSFPELYRTIKGRVIKSGGYFNVFKDEIICSPIYNRFDKLSNKEYRVKLLKDLRKKINK